MYTSTALRDRFVDGALTTASGPKIVVMCFDRLDRDLAGAIEALTEHANEQAHELLCHAQDLLHELLCMLDLEAWEHAPALAEIYRYVLQLLTRANVGKRVQEAAEARHLLGELGGAFRQAAMTLSTTERPAPAERAFSIKA